LYELPTWIGIVLCLSQSAIFSGLNLAFFGVSRLRLEVEARTDDKAARVLRMRRDSNFLLTTILWGNVGINVLLTLLSNSVLLGVSAFLFSTVVITLLGEIGPQAYFSRNPLRMASLLAPVLRVYQFLLYPVAKPTAKLLDLWLGRERVEFLREHALRDMLSRHLEDHTTDVDHVEGIGAMNFLDIDDLSAMEEGEPVDPTSIIRLPVDADLPRIPPYARSMDDPFLRQVHASGKSWVIIANPDGEPRLVLDADGFLRAALLSDPPTSIYDYCHRPIIVRDAKHSLGSIIFKLKQASRSPDDGVLENDVVLVWAREKRIITGADLLGRLLKGIGD
jgi:hypothetical protein